MNSDNATVKGAKSFLKSELKDAIHDLENESDTVSEKSDSGTETE
jgi:hypothetical protein